MYVLKEVIERSEKDDRKRRRGREKAKEGDGGEGEMGRERKRLFLTPYIQYFTICYSLTDVTTHARTHA